MHARVCARARVRTHTARVHINACMGHTHQAMRVASTWHHPAAVNRLGQGERGVITPSGRQRHGGGAQRLIVKEGGGEDAFVCALHLPARSSGRVQPARSRRYRLLACADVPTRVLACIIADLWGHTASGGTPPRPHTHTARQLPLHFPWAHAACMQPCTHATHAAPHATAHILPSLLALRAQKTGSTRCTCRCSAKRSARHAGRTPRRRLEHQEEVRKRGTLMSNACLVGARPHHTCT